MSVESAHCGAGMRQTVTMTLQPDRSVKVVSTGAKEEITEVLKR